MEMIATFIHRAVMQGIPLLYGSTGEIITEKSGNLNLGIPGIMYVGGGCGIIGAFFYQNSVAAITPFWSILIPLLCALLGSAFMSLIYAFLTITLRANQNVTGLALTTMGVGIGNFFGGSLATLYGEGGSLAMTDISKIFRATIPLPEGKFWEIFGNIFLTYGFLAYLAIIIAVIAGIVLTKTRVGLNLRAVGENPATADAAGINVIRYKYVATILGGTIAGLGGLYFIMDYTSGIWSNGGFGDRGWLAIALVIFAIWRPNIGIFGSILFGGLYIVYLFIPGLSRADQELFKMLPYIVTIVVLIATSMRKKRENQPPAHLGLSYFREER
jgi:simple sugar transport system permease protein